MVSLLKPGIQHTYSKYKKVLTFPGSSMLFSKICNIWLYMGSSLAISWLVEGAVSLIKNLLYTGKTTLLSHGVNLGKW